MMNKIKTKLGYFILCVCSIVFILVSCSKNELEERDYRTKYLGNYEFKVIKVFVLDTAFNNGSNKALSGIFDTIEYLGYIDTLQNDKLEIVFSNDISEPRFGCALPLDIQGVLYPTLTDSLVLIYPGVISDCYRNWYRGSFHSDDSVFVNVGTEALMGYYELKIYGKKQ